MPFANHNKTVGSSTPVRISPIESDSVYGYTLAVKLLPGSDTIYVGPKTVTTETGFPISAGEALYVDLDRRERLYAVCATGDTATAFVLATGV